MNPAESLDGSDEGSETVHDTERPPPDTSAEVPSDSPDPPAPIKEPWQKRAAETRWNAVRMAAEKAANAPPHPLFEATIGEKLPEIAFLKVTRIEQPSATSPGGHIDYPRIFPADEITEPEHVIGLLGGGRYEITGYTRDPQTGAKGRLVKTARFNWPGPSIPFFSATGQQAGPAMVAAPHPEPSRGMDPMFAMMLENQRRSDERMFQMQAEQRREAAESSARTMAMIMEGAKLLVGMFINRPPAPLPPPPPDPVAMFTGAINAVTALVPKPDSRDPMDQLGKVVEVAEKLNLGGGAGKKSGESIGDLLGGLGRAMEGFGAVEAMRIEAAKNGLSGNIPTPEQMAESIGVAQQPSAQPPPPSSPPAPQVVRHNGRANEARELED